MGLHKKTEKKETVKGFSRNVEAFFVASAVLLACIRFSFLCAGLKL